MDGYSGLCTACSGIHEAGWLHRTPWIRGGLPPRERRGAPVEEVAEQGALPSQRVWWKVLLVFEGYL
jgi:hypothetical protein